MPLPPSAPAMPSRMSSSGWQAADGTLRGMADTKAFTIANFVNLGIRIFVSFVFAPIFGIRMVWFASPMGWTANFLISYVHLRKTKAFRNVSLFGASEPD